MPVIEKHGGFWYDDPADARTQTMYEQYDPALDLLAVVVRRPSGHFVASLFEKVADHQGRLPFWSERLPDALFDDESSAVAHAKALMRAASEA